MIALDIAGDPIYFLINEDTFPDLPYSTISHLSQFVKTEGVINYYEHNIVRGCTDFGSPGFNFLANIDDGSCEPNTNTYSFGGVFSKVYVCRTRRHVQRHYNN